MTMSSIFSTSGYFMRKTTTFPGLAILTVAVLGVISFYSPWANESSLHAYFYHYGEGYVHRGFIGHVLRLFLGEISFDAMYDVAVNLYFLALITDVILLWILLVPRISGFSSSRPRRIMIGVAAVVLLSPAWKASAVNEPFMDAYVLFFALLAYFAMLKNRPLAFAAFLVMAMLTHRTGAFFGAALGLLGLHAAWISEVHRQKWRWYVAAFAVQPVLFTVLHFMNDPVAAERILAATGEPAILKNMKKYVVNNINANSQNAVIVWAALKAYFSQFVVVVSWHFMPSFILGCALPVLLRDRLTASAGAVLGRRVMQALPPLMVVAPVPIIFFGYDTSRFLGFSWWFLGFAVAHYAWFCVRDGGEEARGTGRRPATVLAVLAWLCAGMPPGKTLMGTLYLPTPCLQFCIPFVTDNIISRAAALKIFQFEAAATYPFTFAAEQFSMFWGVRFYGLKPDGDMLPVPSDFDHPILAVNAFFYPGGILYVTMKHKASSPEPFFIADVAGRYREPEKKSDATMTHWKMPIRTENGRENFFIYRNPEAQNASIISIEVKR